MARVNCPFVVVLVLLASISNRKASQTFLCDVDGRNNPIITLRLAFVLCLCNVGMLLISCNPGNICVLDKATKIVTQKSPLCCNRKPNYYPNTTHRDKITHTFQQTFVACTHGVVPVCSRKLSPLGRG